MLFDNNNRILSPMDFWSLARWANWKQVGQIVQCPLNRSRLLKLKFAKPMQTPVDESYRYRLLSSTDLGLT